MVAGLGRSGFAAADGLLDFGARVIVLDESDAPANAEKAVVLEMLDADRPPGLGIHRDAARGRRSGRHLARLASHGARCSPQAAGFAGFRSGARSNWPGG